MKNALSDRLKGQTHLSLPAFCTGFGQNDTHAVMLRDGRPNPHSSAGAPYDTITGQDIAAMVEAPPSVPKEQAQWFIPSIYAQPDGRSHDAQRNNGAFYWLALDVDQNNLALSDVKEAVSAVLRPCSMLIYSTRSATRDNRKWRALVRLREAVTGADYSDTAAAFYDLLEEQTRGVLICDRALERAGQLVYLPNRGEYYECHVERATPLALTSEHPILQRRDRDRVSRAQADAEARAARDFKAAQRRESGQSDAIDPVAHFNEAHCIADLLERYGYSRSGDGDDWRSPMQQSGSYATRDCGEHWLSLSGSDEAADIGAVSKGGHRYGDAFDLFVHFEHAGDYHNAVAAYGAELREVDQRTFESQPKPHVKEGPQLLVREIPRGADYPVQALGPLRAAVEAVQATTQAPMAIAAQSALSVASLAVQAHANVETLAGYMPTSLFCLTIAQSGERKSGCDKLVMSGLREFERDRASDYRTDMAEWTSAQKLWDAQRDRMIKEAAGNNKDKALKAEADLASLGSEPARPPSPKLTTSEPTLEGLIKLFLVGQPSLGLFSDEGGGFLGGHAMNSDNRLKTVAGLSSLWGGDAIDRVRAGDGATTLYGRRLALHLMVQPVAARPLLSDPIASGQGFLARFLITEPPSAIGTRKSQKATNVADVAVVAATNRLITVLNHPKPMSEDSPQELCPRALPLSHTAMELLREYYNVTEEAQAPGGELEHVKSFASKSPEQAARIAGVLTLWADLNAPDVTAETMVNAITLAQFYLGEAKRLAEAATISEKIDRADKLRRWILESWPKIAVSQNRSPNTIMPRDVVVSGPGSLRETETVRGLMKVLANHGWLIEVPKGVLVDGSVRQIAYQIVPEP